MLYIDSSELYITSKILQSTQTVIDKLYIHCHVFYQNGMSLNRSLHRSINISNSIIFRPFFSYDFYILCAFCCYLIQFQLLTCMRFHNYSKIMDLYYILMERNNKFLINGSVAEFYAWKFVLPFLFKNLNSLQSYEQFSKSFKVADTF